MIVDPITMSPEDKIADALEVMRRYRISGVPITKNKKLVGILTNRDLRFETRTDIPISEVMTKENLITVPVGTTLSDAEAILHQHRIEKLLVVDDRLQPERPDHGKGHPEAAEVSHGRQGCAWPPAGRRGHRRDRRFPGARAGDGAGQSRPAGHRQRAWALHPRARSHQEDQAKLPEVDLIAGNVGTFDGACELARAGADAHQSRHRPGLHLHHPRRHRRRRAADHRHCRSRARHARQRRSRSSPMAASSTPATSPRPSPPARAAS